MKISEYEMTKEAVKRMKKLGIMKEAITAFKNDGIIMESESPLGALYDIDEEQSKLVADFELENDAIVYFIVRTHTEFGIFDSLFYVNDHDDEWCLENEDIEDGYPMVYTHNYNAPFCSEYGLIEVKKSNGGLLRTA